MNPDSIRLAIHGQVFLPQAEALVWAHAEVMVRSLFLAGHDVVILDATAGKKRDRDRWACTQWETKFRVFDTDAETCKTRACDFVRDDLVPVIERMVRTWEPLDESERTYLIDGDLATAKS